MLSNYCLPSSSIHLFVDRFLAIHQKCCKGGNSPHKFYQHFDQIKFSAMSFDLQNYV